jgi:hypothetical protein
MVGGSSPGKGWEFFSSPPLPDRLWGPPSLLFNGYKGPLPWGSSGWGVKLTPHLHIYISLPPNTPPGTLPLLRHEDVWWSGGIAPCILNIDTGWRCSHFTPRYPLDMRLGGLQIQSGRGGEEKNSLTRYSIPGRPARSLVTLLTKLTRLLFSIEERDKADCGGCAI